jgi:glycosyltransferase involved in cell wall biosynthesis
MDVHTKSMALSIVMFCGQYLPVVGGTERQAEKLSRALVRAGCRVKILTPRLSRNAPPHEVVDGVEIVRFQMFDLARLIPIRGIALPNIAVLRWGIEKALSSHLSDADILHAHGASLLSGFAISEAHKRNIPTLCKLAVSGPNELILLGRKPVYGAKLARLMIAETSQFLAISCDIAEELRQSGVTSAKIATVPNGVSLPSSRSIRSAARNFLYVGRLSTNINRDLTTVLLAFNKIAATRTEIELTIVGGGDLFEETRLFARSLSAADRIRFTGIADPEPWYAWGDVFVLPSRQEGLSNALLEAMSHGLACIANDIPSNREVLDEGRAGLVTPIGDVDVLSSHMEQLVDSEPFLKAMSVAARERAEKVYDIDKVSACLIELYCSLIAERHTDRSKNSAF